ncbi:MAG TPA: hypothetical protein VL856_02430 [Acidimicrobiia bacterium]|nr:hypothetical protein [Acidimicrobiia bacterium]
MWLRGGTLLAFPRAIMKTFVVAALLLSFAGVAQAQPSDVQSTGRTLRRVEVSGTAGVATPLGMFGIEGTYVVHRNLEVGLGVGLANVINIGDTGAPDPQLAIMPRFRIPVGSFTFTLGAGLSGGPYTVASSPFADGPYEEKTSAALWLNGEAGAEYFLNNGMFFGAYLGGGKVIAHARVNDPDGNATMNPLVGADALPYLGLRVGHSF